MRSKFFACILITQHIPLSGVWLVLADPTPCWGLEKLFCSDLTGHRSNRVKIRQLVQNLKDLWSQWMSQYCSAHVSRTIRSAENIFIKPWPLPPCVWVFFNSRIFFILEFFLNLGPPLHTHLPTAGCKTCPVTNFKLLILYKRSKAVNCQ